MTGAESVLRTLAASGVDTCFANPGTSEMHLVAALDRVPEVRPILTLFEGVASGAADGYGRMTGVPGGDAAAPRAGARERVREPPQRLQGADAARERGRRPRGAHPPLGAPLASDIESVARPVSHWSRRTATPGRPPATPPRRWPPPAARRRIATLIVPADAGWEPAPGPAAPVAPAPPAPPSRRRRRGRRARAALGRARRAS